MKSKILKKVMYTYVCTYICQLTTTYLFVYETPGPVALVSLDLEEYFMIKIISIIIIINTRIPPVVAPIIIFTNSMLSASDVDVLFADESKDFTIT